MTAPLQSSDPSPMRFEEQRLSTFTSWPRDAKVEAGKIAKAGFFHTGRETEVKCSWCGCVLTEWDYGDQVMARHRSASPECPFVRNQSDNVPLARGGAEQPSTSNQSLAIPNSSQISNGDPQRSPNSVDHAEMMLDDPPSSFMAPPPGNPPSFSRQTSLPTAANENFKSEVARLRTYVNWPLSYIRPRDLAKSGFVYTGRNDCVRCVFCGEYVGDWDLNDVPDVEHRNLFPHCPFVQGLDVGNVSDEGGESSTSTSSLRGSAGSSLDLPMSDPGSYDETGIRRPHRDIHSGPEKGSSVLHYINCPKPGEELPGVIRHSGPAHTKYSTPEARLRTFKDWPPGLKQQPKQLAEAGFYYIGLSDQVKCFYCDGGLRNWQQDDEPWAEHSRWFSECGFVRLIKGDKFIAKCLAERPPQAGPDVPVRGPNGPRYEVREEDVRAMMSSPIVHGALAMGIDASRIKMALRGRLKATGGVGFHSRDELIAAAFNVHREQEDRVNVENNPSMSPFLRDSSATHAPLQDHFAQTAQGSSAQRSPPASESSAQRSPPASESSRTTPTNSQESQDEDTAGPHVPASQPSSAPRPSGSSSQASEEQMEVSPPSTIQSEGSSDLEQENRRLREQRTCKICMDNEFEVVFIPCGHLICCVHCAPALKDCPLCRQPIQCTVRAYMS